MPRKMRQLRADLRRAGFYNRGGHGRHQNWVHDWLPGVRVTLAGADGDDVQPYQEDDLRLALADLATETARREAETKQEKDR